MTFTDACRQLNEWIDSSQGRPINIGGDDLFAFESDGKTDGQQIQSFQDRLQLTLPEEYCDFLQRVGPARLFAGRYSAGFEILPPGEIRSFSKTVFENFGDDLFPDLLLVASIPKSGAFGGFWLPGKSGKNFGIFFPDMPPELWIEETDFMGFCDWIVSITRNKGRYTVG